MFHGDHTIMEWNGKLITSKTGTPGFTAASGWDPVSTVPFEMGWHALNAALKKVTGLGTPNFPKLLARWLLLP